MKILIVILGKPLNLSGPYFYASVVRTVIMYISQGGYEDQIE
jgi:hypothetical protein